ncbi:MAG: serine--tRNA ligase [Pseudomonadota bacterium]
MHDIRAITASPESFDGGLARRGLEPAAAELIALDTQRRKLTTEIQELRTRQKKASKDFQSQSQGTEALRQDMAAIKKTIGEKEDHLFQVQDTLKSALAPLPNLPDPDVPPGTDETDNQELERWGDTLRADCPRRHTDFPGVDFESARRVAGARFVYLRGAIARLHRALGQFMIETHTQHNGYTEVAPPLLVNDATVFGVGQLPKFAEDLFHTTDGRWLISTSEVSLTALAGDTIFAEDDLPLRFTAQTPCFRSEAGAAGKDTRGMIRQHQFDKVELVSITRPQDSAAEHERMTRCARNILEALELPYRIVILCSGDMGFAAQKTYDLEVWLPSQQTYREISSCSNCGAFQARRLAARYRPKKQQGKQGDIEFVHTLNGSGLAMGRALIALLENHQADDGTINIPNALRPYLGGVSTLSC